MTYEAILKRMLDKTPNDMDKREGSVLYNALAPAAFELAQMYSELEFVRDITFADTSTGEDLTRRCAEHGINRKPATKAVRKGEFNTQIPLGARFSIEGVLYQVTKKISNTEYELTCEVSGEIGNTHFGTLLPVDYVEGLTLAKLVDILIPAQDEESDEALRERYYQIVNEPAFAGNISAYQQLLNEQDGVGGAKVFPAWQGGGSVKCTLISSDFLSPSEALIENVQTFVDPEVNQGEGYGSAPIGHIVTIAGAKSVEIEIETTLTLEIGVTIGQVRDSIEEVIDTYLSDLRKDWDSQETIIVRTAQIDARILTIAGVQDIKDTYLNGGTENIILGSEEIPIKGAVTLNA